MSKTAILGKINKFRNSGVSVAKLLGVSAASGGAVGFTGGEAGLRKHGLEEGVAIGLGVGALILSTPKIGALVKRSGFKSAKMTTRRLASTGRIMFRRVRGRIIPIRK